MSLINRGESKPDCPVGLMSAGIESSGVMKGRSLLQKCLNQRFSVLQQVHTCMKLQLSRGCSDTCEPQRGTEAQLIAVLSASPLLHRMQHRFFLFLEWKPTSYKLTRHFIKEEQEIYEVEIKENKKLN